MPDDSRPSDDSAAASSPEGAAPDRPVPSLVALEYVTDDGGPLLELLCDHLGFAVVDRRPHPALDAEMIIVDAGTVAITVLWRTDDGDRPQVPPTPSALSQLVFDVDDRDGGFTRLVDHLVEAGAPVVADSADTCHLDRQLTESVFGTAPTIVFHRDG